MAIEHPLKQIGRKIIFSLVLGAVGFCLNHYSFTFLYMEIELSLGLGQIFPLMIAFSWGWLYSVPATVISSSFIFFSSSSGGAASLYLFLVYALFAPLMGWYEEKRRWTDGSLFSLYVVLLIFSVIHSLIYFFLYNILAPVPESWKFLLIHSYVDNMTFLSSLNLVNLLLILPPVRFLMGNEELTEMKTRMGYRFILSTVVSMFILWGFTMSTEMMIEGDGHLGAEADRLELAELFINNLLYLNLIILTSIVLYQNWEIKSSTKRRIAERGDILIQILNNISEGVLVLDSDWKIRFANPAAMGMGPFYPNEIGRRINRVVTLHSAETGLRFSHKDIIKFLTSGKSLTCLMATKDNSFRRIIITLSSLPKTKHGYRYLSLIRDITEEYEQEQRNIHIQKQEAVGRLVGGVAHDFNNRLAGILGFSQLIGNESNLDEIYYYADQITESAQAAADLTTQLLTLSRKRPMKRQILVLNDIVQGVLPVLKHTISKEIMIHFQGSEGRLAIEGDKSLLENAFLNLAINGAHAMDKKGILTFAVSLREIDEVYCIKSKARITAGAYGCVSITDSGAGIKPEIREKIFDPFFTTKKEGEGTGLGLSTVKEIVEKHNGEITVSSQLGKGTTFTLLFPLVQEGRA